jgi:hypothetical protein
VDRVGQDASNIVGDVGELGDGDERAAEGVDQARLDAIAAADRERVAAANRLSRDRSMIEAGRRAGGLAGAMVAGAMIAVRDVVEGPPKDQGSVVVDAPTEPEDLDADGTTLSADEVGGGQDIAVPAQPRRPPVTARRTSRRRRP